MRADKKQLCRGETALNSCMYKGSYVEEKLPCRDAAADSKQLCRTRREKALQRKKQLCRGELCRGAAQKRRNDCRDGSSVEKTQPCSKKKKTSPVDAVWR